MAKKAILIEHDGGELGNQLWNAVSVYAYALEKGFEFENYSFFEYSRYFKYLEPNNGFLKAFFFKPFRRYSKRRNSLQAKIWRTLYRAFVVIPMKFFCKKILVTSIKQGSPVFYLPPTEGSVGVLKKVEENNSDVCFAQISGGVFRNPLGLSKHGDKVREKFVPTEEVLAKVNPYIQNIRQKFSHVVGVHIRQTDYKQFKSGKFYISTDRVKQILSEYIESQGLDMNKTAFIIASDGDVDLSVFKDMNVFFEKRSIGVDLFLLAACDVVVGSDSTFGHFASYYGNVPHIIMKNESIDWQYYSGVKKYTENKYLTVMAF